ncbi:MAG: hypothetical protein LBV80_09625 [Deltaproteobacteria bacterium]|jgi:transcription elongation factor Elf1|nr:hypothetical protein [Deltaproteobacteria bacterium]
MASEKFTCENCGFEEELSAAQIDERKTLGLYATCSKCGGGMTEASTAAKGKKTTGKAKPAEADVTAEAGETGQTAEGEKSKGDAAMDSAKQAAEAARAKLKEAFSAGRKDPIFIANLIDTGLKKVTSLLCPDCFDKNASRAITLGHYAILLLALLCPIMGLIIGIRTNISQIILSGFGGAVLLLFAQYLAVKSFSLFDGIIANHQTRLSGPALVEIVATLNILAAIGGIIMIVTGIMDGFATSMIAGGVLCLLFGYLSAVLLMQADKQLNVEYDPETSLGEQFIGIISVSVKTAVRLMPFIFGLGLAVVTVLCIPAAITFLIKGSGQGMAELMGLFSAAVTLAFWPIMFYMLLMLVYLFIDLLKAILSLAKK